jgi:hypothetical protein
MTLGGAIRQAAVDFYYNSWRFVPANVAWALTLLAVMMLASLWAPAIVLLVLLAAPLAGIQRMATRLARGEATSLSDFAEGTRRYGLQAVGIAAGAATLATVLGTNVIVGFGSEGPLGWFVGASAMYGLVALAMYLVAVWPVLVDPSHEGTSLRRRLQVAGLVLLGRPGRLFLVTILIVAVLALSTVLIAGIVLFGVAYSSLFASRWVLPTADALEARYEAARAR